VKIDMRGLAGLGGSRPKNDLAHPHPNNKEI
jgi:hypothetical protein